MSRSNGPAFPAGGPPLQWPDSAETAALAQRPGAPAAAAPARRPAMQPQQAVQNAPHHHPQQAFHQPHAAPQHMAQQQAPVQSHHGVQSHPAYHYPQGGLAHPGQGGLAHPGHGGVAAQQRPAAPQARGSQGLVPPVMGGGHHDFGAPPRAGYAPQFERAFDPASQAQAPAHAGYANGHHSAAQHDAYAAQAASRQPRTAPPRPDTQQPPAATPQQARSWMAPAVAPGQPQAVPNPANYDFGSYYPSANGLGQAHPFNDGQGQGHAGGAGGLAQRHVETRGYPDTSRGDPGLASLDWQSRPPTHQGGDGEYLDPAYDHAGADQDPNAYPPDETYDVDPDQAPRSSVRKWLVIGTLVGAIGVGAGLAKGYSWWQSRPAAQADTRGTRSPTIAAIKPPAKIKPVETASKDVPHQGITVLNGADSRPPEGSTPAKGMDVDGAPRKVHTLVVGKDGSMQAPAAPLPPAPATASVPGMIVELPRRPAPPEGAPGVAPKVAVPIQPKVISVPPPGPAQVAAAPQGQPAPAQPQGRVITVPPRQPVPKAGTPPAKVAGAAPAAAPTGAGYVAAVVSKKSQMEALTALADLQQKYPAVLQGKTATVQEANLGDKGIWYRVIVGPPASREAATNVCGQLKGQGFNGCWTFAY